MVKNQNNTMEIGRLKKRSEFLALRRGQKRRGKYFLLEILDRDGVGSTKPRVGYTVTRKQGNAVQRNRIRRRLKEAVRLNSHLFENAYHDYVLVGHKDLLEAEFSDIIYVLKQRFLSHKNSDRRRGNEADAFRAQ